MNSSLDFRPEVLEFLVLLDVLSTSRRSPTKKILAGRTTTKVTSGRLISTQGKMALDFFCNASHLSIDRDEEDAPRSSKGARGVDTLFSIGNIHFVS